MKKNEDYIEDYFDCEDDEDRLSDEELDELYRPKKALSRKSMISLFIYKFLVENSSPDHCYSHKEIGEKLLQYPYEIKVERKAVARAIHGLEDTGFGIITIPRKGVCYDEERIWA